MDVFVQFCLQNVPVLSLFSSYTPHEKLARHTAAPLYSMCTLLQQQWVLKILRGWISRRVIHENSLKKMKKMVKTHVYAPCDASIGLTGLVLHWILMSNQVESCSCSGLGAEQLPRGRVGGAAALSSADVVSGATWWRKSFNLFIERNTEYIRISIKEIKS